MKPKFSFSKLSAAYRPLL